MRTKHTRRTADGMQVWDVYAQAWVWAVSASNEALAALPTRARLRAMRAARVERSEIADAGMCDGVSSTRGPR